MARLIVKVKTTAPRPQENDDTNTVVLMVGSTPQGDKGLKGDKGDKGDKGEQGEQGTQGIQGLKGDKGIQGIQGLKGAQGVQGLKGDTGDKGDPFIYTDFTPPQLAALKGAKGDTGNTGARGLKGDKGDKGDTGASGNGAWGTITGNIADQTDLSELYYTKAQADGKTTLLFTGLEHLALNGEYYATTTTAHPNVNIAADGKLSRSTATVVTKDNAGNVAVASIQAGIGAPKIAYKKLAGVTASGNNVPHGLDASKILSISCAYLSGVVYRDSRPSWDATEIETKAISSGFPYNILITYEVD